MNEKRDSAGSTRLESSQTALSRSPKRVANALSASRAPPLSTRWEIRTASPLRSGARPPGTIVLRGSGRPLPGARRVRDVSAMKFSTICAPCSVPTDSG